MVPFQAHVSSNSWPDPVGATPPNSRTRPLMLSYAMAEPDRGEGLWGGARCVHVLPFQTHVSACAGAPNDAPAGGGSSPKSTTVPLAGSSAIAGPSRYGGFVGGDSSAQVPFFHNQV